MITHQDTKQLELEAGWCRLLGDPKACTNPDSVVLG